MLHRQVKIKSLKRFDKGDKGLSALTGKCVNNNKKSAVKDHCLFLNHMDSLEDFSILKYKLNPFKLLIKEALLV